MASFGDATIFLFSILNTILFTMLDIANHKPLGHGKHNVIDRGLPFHISLSLSLFMYSSTVFIPYFFSRRQGLRESP